MECICCLRTSVKVIVLKTGMVIEDRYITLQRGEEM